MQRALFKSESGKLMQLTYIQSEAILAPSKFHTKLPFEQHSQHTSCQNHVETPENLCAFQCFQSVLVQLVVFLVVMLSQKLCMFLNEFESIPVQQIRKLHQYFFSLQAFLVWFIQYYCRYAKRLQNNVLRFLEALPAKCEKQSEIIDRYYLY